MRLVFVKPVVLFIEKRNEMSHHQIMSKWLPAVGKNVFRIRSMWTCSRFSPEKFKSQIHLD